MIISLGSILLKTDPRSEERDVAAMHGAGATSEDILKTMMDQAYDKFNLNIDNIQVNGIQKKTFFFFLKKIIFLMMKIELSLIQNPYSRSLDFIS